MNQLIKVSNYLYLCIAATMIVAALILYYVLNMQIESTIKANLSTSGFSKQSVLISPSDVYKVNVGNTITLDVNGKYYVTQIKSITFDETRKMFALELRGLNINLIPDSLIRVTIIYDYHKVLGQLFGSV